MSDKCASSLNYKDEYHRLNELCAKQQVMISGYESTLASRNERIAYLAGQVKGFEFCVERWKLNNDQ